VVEIFDVPKGVSAKSSSKIVQETPMIVAEEMSEWATSMP